MTVVNKPCPLAVPSNSVCINPWHLCYHYNITIKKWSSEAQHFLGLYPYTPLATAIALPNKEVLLHNWWIALKFAILGTGQEI